MRVASLVSGGKDSIFASLLAQERGWDVTHYVTIHPEAEHPYLYHRPNLDWVGLQARCAGVEHVTVASGEGDAAETMALRDALRNLPVDAVTSGAVASEYQRVRIEAACHEFGLRSYAPLWHHDPLEHIKDVVAAGIRSVFVRVAAEGLGKDWLGRPLDARAVEDLERVASLRGINPAGEGGEYETFVVDAPHFRQRVQIDESEGFWRRDEGTLEIRRARLAFKAIPPLEQP